MSSKPCLKGFKLPPGTSVNKPARRGNLRFFGWTPWIRFDRVLSCVFLDKFLVEFQEALRIPGVKSVKPG